VRAVLASVLRAEDGRVRAHIREFVLYACVSVRAHARDLTHHAQCSPCLAQLIAQSQRCVCPLCREPLARKMPSINVVLRGVIEKAFPDEYIERVEDGRREYEVRSCAAHNPTHTPAIDDAARTRGRAGETERHRRRRGGARCAVVLFRSVGRHTLQTDATAGLVTCVL
jgi:hypothetical protein